MTYSELTFDQLERQIIGRFKDNGVANSVRDAQLLIQAASGMDRAALMARSNDNCPQEVLDCAAGYARRRLAREPVFRIIGEREFHGLPLKLNHATLEPRDDTECLVEACLELIGNRNKKIRFLDLGTGSGAVALALLAELPNASVTATDIELPALEVALQNATTCGFDDRFEVLQSNWLGQVADRYDFIVSNPPYIKSDVVDGLGAEVLNHDPRLALDGGADGLSAYREIFDHASDCLNRGGFLAVETGFDQKQDVIDCGTQSGWSLLRAARDLAGQDRALIFTNQASRVG